MYPNAGRGTMANTEDGMGAGSPLDQPPHLPNREGVTLVYLHAG
jgi:hypothetical protein